MKRRPITEKEEYIRDAILNQYKRAHKYEIKTLMFFLVSCIFAIFLSINVLIAIFKWIRRHGSFFIVRGIFRELWNTYR